MLWKYSHEEIRQVLDKLFGNNWVDYHMTSGLYVWVVMDDGSQKTVYSHQFEEIV